MGATNDSQIAIAQSCIQAFDTRPQRVRKSGRVFNHPANNKIIVICRAQARDQNADSSNETAEEGDDGVD